MAMCNTILDYLSLLIQRATEAHHSKITREDFIADFEIPIQYQQWQGVNGIKANLSKVYTDLQPTRKRPCKRGPFNVTKVDKIAIIADSMTKITARIATTDARTINYF